MVRKNMVHDDVTLDDINDDLCQQIEAEVERADNFLGMLAVERDLVGQMMISLCKPKSKQGSKLNAKDVTEQIEKLLPMMSLDQKIAIKGAVEFHIAAKKFNEQYPDLVPSWRDDHPLSRIEKLDFTNIINRYY